MLKQAYVVTDLGPGDGGKGSIVHFLAQKHQADIIIKRGGAQGSHGVCTSTGAKFNFSQWGCATFEAVPTFCSRQMVIAPLGLKNEAEALQRLGVNNPFQLLTVDVDCLCATPYHRVASQIEALLQKDHPRGTTGAGIGQAYRMSQAVRRDYSLRAFQMGKVSTIEKVLQLQRAYYREKYYCVSHHDVLLEDVVQLRKLLDLLQDGEYLDYCVAIFAEVYQQLEFDDLEHVVEKYQTAIVECSHGVLTDAEVGLTPHVSAIRTLPKFSEQMLREAGYHGEITHLAVHRAYEIRHGAGPMPTYDPDLTQTMAAESHKADNRWQGSARMGALDLALLRYAIKVCEPEITFQGLCLTWFDQVLKSNDRAWLINEGYANWQKPRETLTEFLQNRAQPQIVRCLIETGISQAEIFRKVATIIENQVNIPLSILSLGPTEQDKVCSPIYV